MKNISAISDLSAALRLDGHQLNFLTPVDDPLYGIALGDGSTGLLYRPDKDKLTFNINHTDLWRESGEKEIHNWDLDSEENTNSLLSAGVLEIYYNNPAFETIYQQDYRATLSLKTATLDMYSKTPFSEVRFNAFCSKQYAASVIRLNASFSEQTFCRITLKNWGSRTFGHWYAQINRDPTRGLDDTDCAIEDNIVFVKRELNERVFCTALFAENCNDKNIVNSHGIDITTDKSANQQNTLILTVVIANDFESAKQIARQRIDRVYHNLDKVYEAHKADWTSFWDKSYVQLEDDYLENLWYLNNYYANCQMHGAYPPHFCNGIWGFNHDYVPWNHMFHWNMQLAYWGLLAAGHGELTKTYLNFRFKQLPFAIETGKRYRNVEGALYTDVSGANAVCDANTVDNLTPGAQIAHAFWQYYLYSGDIDYLCDKGYAVIYSAAMLYLNLLKKGNDGFYHLYRSQAYESSPIMDDVITDSGAMRTVFSDLISCINLLTLQNKIEKPNCYNKLTDVLNNLAPVKTVPLEDDEYKVIKSEKFIASGVGRGTKIEFDAAPVAGVFCGEERNSDEAELEDQQYWSKVKKGDFIRNSFSSRKLQHYYGFPDPEYSYVFPNSCIGLSQRGEKLFCAMQNLMLMKEPFVFADENQISLNQNERIPGMGWSLDPIVLARLGLADQLKQRLNDSIAAWQWYPNGLGHYGPYYNMQNESNLRFYTHNVRDVMTGERFDFPAWEFRHFDYEMLPITAMAVNEMLLQSFEGVIRVFPAVVDGYTGSFKLHAENSLVVYSSITNGEVDYIYICGNRKNAGIVNPWNHTPFVWDKDGNQIDFSECKANKDSIIFCNIKESVLITKDENPFHIHNIILQENTQSKQRQKSSLGIQKMY